MLLTLSIGSVCIGLLLVGYALCRRRMATVSHLRRAHQARAAGDQRLALRLVRRVVGRRRRVDPVQATILLSAVAVYENILLELGVDAPARLHHLIRRLNRASRDGGVLDKDLVDWFRGLLDTSIAALRGVSSAAQSRQLLSTVIDAERPRLIVEETVGFDGHAAVSLDTIKYARLIAGS